MHASQEALLSDRHLDVVGQSQVGLRRFMQNAGGSSDYVSASALAFSANKHIPTVSRSELKFQRYRPEAKNFDDFDKKQVTDFEDQSGAIKESDTGMTPFIKNQNEYL